MQTSAPPDWDCISRLADHGESIASARYLRPAVYNHLSVHCDGLLPLYILKY